MHVDQSRFWVTSAVDVARNHVDSPVLASILAIGWLPIALSIVAIDTSEATVLFVVAQTLAALMVVFGPFDVWYYYRRLLPAFFENVDDIVEPGQDDELRALAEKYDRFFTQRWWAITLPWTLLVVLVFFASEGHIANQGITSPVEYTAYFGFFVYWGLFSGLGFHGGLLTVRLIKEFSEEIDLEIDPLYPDGLGGLSLVGQFAIRTTLILSTGSLAMPLSFELASQIGLAEAVYLGVGLYVVLIALVFIYPTYKVNRRAQRLREDVLEEYRTKIRRLEAELAKLEAAGRPGASLEESHSLYLEIDRTRQEFRDFRDVQLYPLSVSILIQLLSSLFLPVLFIIFDIYLSRLI
ncbi:hypothetical protein GJR96_03190 [Haloferax sp. MBLA0076]|uniref:Uncharacterized protein n=1 Tax=Haloferax litoreum TaxID=2666140 RepID=A0A6A8GCS1_9EURY|nr:MULTISPECIES: hypothetical protein [Haloferax]KAB1192493.1 hypothetical protein Hfx1148_03185 [Haloferax sp. CBA1148]MRX20963.1 hypothetical protein [Haloferax litoreum]